MSSTAIAVEVAKASEEDPVKAVIASLPEVVEEEETKEAQVILLQQGTRFDLTLSHEACNDDEYLVTDVSAPVGVCAASKNVLTYTPPFDITGRVVVTYKTTVKGQAPEDKTLLIDVTEAPKPDVQRFTVPQGATVKITLTAEDCDDDEYDVEEARADLGVCLLEKNVLTFTSPADKMGEVLLTYRGRVKGGPPQDRQIIVTVTETPKEAAIKPVAIKYAKTLVFSKDTQHVIGMNDHDHGREIMAHLEVAHAETDAKTGNVRMSFANKAALTNAVAWAKARKIEELAKHIERGCTHPFCERTRLAAEAQTLVEVKEAEAAAVKLKGAAKKDAKKQITRLKSQIGRAHV